MRHSHEKNHLPHLRARAHAGAFEHRKAHPLTLLVSLAVQFIGVVCWATYLEARVAVLEETKTAAYSLSEKFARLEERIDAVRTDIAVLRQEMRK